MNATTLRRCQHDVCRKEFRWASNEVGRSVPIDPEPVAPRTRGARVLIGERLFSLPDAVTHLTRRGFAADEAEAARMATEDYLWHLPHQVACVYEQERRQGL